MTCRRMLQRRRVTGPFDNVREGVREEVGYKKQIQKECTLSTQMKQSRQEIVAVCTYIVCPIMKQN